MNLLYIIYTRIYTYIRIYIYMYCIHDIPLSFLESLSDSSAPSNTGSKVTTRLLPHGLRCKNSQEPVEGPQKVKPNTANTVGWYVPDVHLIDFCISPLRLIGNAIESISCTAGIRTKRVL